MKYRSLQVAGIFAAFLAYLVFAGATATALAAAAVFSAGDLVRLSRGETLTSEGKNLAIAPKGQEFTVLKHDPRQSVVEVAYFKPDGSLIAASLPADALEPSSQDGWADLSKSMEAFRDQRFEEMKRLLLHAAQDQQYRSLTSPLTARINTALAAAAQALSAEPARAPAARQAFATTLQGLRDTAEQLCKLGYQSLALPLDEGADRLGARVFGNSKTAAAENPGAIVAPPSKVDRDDLFKRVSVSNRSLSRCRQAVAQHRLVEATKFIDDGLTAEPGRPELKALQTRIQRDLAEADEQYEAASRMRRFEGGAVHALNALDRGMRLCADHPKLLALKKEMQSAFEERTAPPVTPAFLAAARTSVSREALEEGRRIYTTRCTECHDLELVDSRSIGGWEKMVSSMSRRAHVDAAQQARILDYLAAAQNGIESGKR
jgi:hypothetical protein